MHSRRDDLLKFLIGFVETPRVVLEQVEGAVFKPPNRRVSSPPPPADDDGCVYRVRQTARKLLTSTAITSTSPPNVRRRMGGGRLTLGLPRVGVRSSDQLLSKVTGWGYGNSYAIWDHRVLPVTRQRWHSRLYPCQLKLELWRSFSSLSSSLCPNYDFE